MRTLIVVDMQNDFIDGALANPAAQAIIPAMTQYIEGFVGEIIFTRDTHFANYLDTQEGKNLPITHCLHGTSGWKVHGDLLKAACRDGRYWSCKVNKMSFGDVNGLVETMDAYSDEIYICGTCTDICVVSIALNLKAQFPEKKIYCLSGLCAGTSPEAHDAALMVMRSCQIEVI